MVYISSWHEYQTAAEELYAKSPDKARYCVKWKAGASQLVLKITDDVTCLKFKTHSSIFLNRFEALNHSLMLKMTNHRAPPPAPVQPQPSLASKSTPVQVSSPGGDISRSNTPQPQAGAGGRGTPVQGPSGGGVTKKKGKKKK